MIDNKFLHYLTKSGFETDLELYGIDALMNKIVFIKDDAAIWTHGTYYGSGDGVKHIFLTATQYAALDSYLKNAIYFIVDTPEDSNWTFGETFPIILT